MTLLSDILSFVQPWVTPLTIIGVGYWVNVTISKKNKRNSIVIDYVQKLQTNMHKLIDNSINAEDIERCTENLRSLSNEINYLIDLYLSLNEENPKKHTDHQELKDALFDFKKYLTASGCKAEGEDLERARQSSNKLRKILLDILLNICESYS